MREAFVYSLILAAVFAVGLLVGGFLTQVMGGTP